MILRVIIYFFHIFLKFINLFSCHAAIPKMVCVTQQAQPITDQCKLTLLLKYAYKKESTTRRRRGSDDRTTKRSRRQAITLKCLIFELAVAVN